jgi:hypothetical protein
MHSKFLAPLYRRLPPQTPDEALRRLLPSQPPHSGRGFLKCRLARAPFAHFWSTLILASWFIEGDGNVDTLDYRDRLRRWCFG